MFAVFFVSIHVLNNYLLLNLMNIVNVKNVIVQFQIGKNQNLEFNLEFQSIYFFLV